MKGSIVAVCRSERTGVPKKPIDSGVLRVDWGLEGDAHAGDWHRQVSFLAIESIDKMRAQGLNVNPGSFAENITTQGLELYTLPLGTILRVGSALVQVTQIGKVCHVRCAIYQAAGDCVMPREGIFCRVLEPGNVCAGDTVEIVEMGSGAAVDDTRGPHVVAVSLSKERGTPKRPVAHIEVRPGHGVVGDAHAGDWHRQVSLLAQESIDKALARGLEVGPGSFAENITTRGLHLLDLPVGTRLQMGPAVLEVTQIGKDPHEHDVIHELVGDSVIPREGIFGRVLTGGIVKGGDAINVLDVGAEDAAS